MTKTIYLLNIDNYAPEITAITYPRIEAWAKKIGAEIVKITDRKFPDMPLVYEKFQLYDLAKENKSDWNIFIDSDALLHENLFDITELLDKDTVFQVGRDFSPIRFKKNDFMLRDGRNIGTCNWFTIFSDWCLDLYNRDIGMTYDEIMEHCFVTNKEKWIFDRKHLIDDYILASNVARYGLKMINWQELSEKFKFPNDGFFYHEYLIPAEEKVIRLKQTDIDWHDIDYPKLDLENAINSRNRGAISGQKDVISGQNE
jgi:hypothetical protein